MTVHINVNPPPPSSFVSGAAAAGISAIVGFDAAISGIPSFSVKSAAVVAGVIVSAASLGQIEDVNPALQWMLAVIGGGGMAGTIQIGSALTRAASTTTTGGVANPVVSTAEAGGAVVCSVLAVIVPVVAVVVVLVLMTFIVRRLIRKKRAVPES